MDSFSTTLTKCGSPFLLYSTVMKKWQTDFLYFSPRAHSVRTSPVKGRQAFAAKSHLYIDPDPR